MEPLNTEAPARHRLSPGRANYLYIAVPFLSLTWIVFKYFYPFADFFNDSYTYIQAAANHEVISYRPIGYSVFLEVVHWICVRDFFLVTVQYVLVQGGCLYLFFTLLRWCSLPSWGEWLLLGFLLLNPLIHYICNCVSSDALFIGLSLFWFAVLLRLVCRPTLWLAIVQGVLLALIFYTRYMALCYPLVSIVAFCLAYRGKRREGRTTFKSRAWAIGGIIGSVGIIFSGIFHMRTLTRKETGAAVFSAFSGWQIANNVLHIYPWLPVDSTGFPSPQSQQLASYVSQYFKDAGPAVKNRSLLAATGYMWERNSPLHRYLTVYQEKNSPLRLSPDTGALPYFTAWNRVGPIFSEYGYHLLRRHPITFTRYYCWPSAAGYFFSPLDVFALYNEGKPEVDPLAKKWFHYPTTRLTVRSPAIQGTLLAPWPWIFLFLNGAFIIVATLFFSDEETRGRQPLFTACYELALVYFLVNTGFSIFASPSVFRYQVLPLILLAVFTAAGGLVRFGNFWYLTDLKR